MGLASKAAVVGGIGTLPGNITVTKAYETNRNLIDYVENNVGATVVSKYDYTNDANGRRAAVSMSGTAFAAADTIDYGYNGRNELVSADAVNDPDYDYTYSYDPIGNRLSSTDPDPVEGPRTTTYTTNSLSQYTSTSTTPPTPPTVNSFSYDDDGNMLSDGEWTYTWNGENRLIAVEKSEQGGDPDSSGPADTKLTFLYDYQSSWQEDSNRRRSPSQSGTRVSVPAAAPAASQAAPSSCPLSPCPGM